MTDLTISEQNLQDYLLKIKFEKKLAVRMNKLFSHMAAEANALYRINGDIIDLDHYDVELRGILMHHYREVSKKFKYRLRITLEKSYNVIYNQKSINDEVDTIINEYIIMRSKKQSNIIMNTTKKDLDNAYMQSNLVSLVEGHEFLTEAELAEQANAEFLALARARSKTIGLTETQNMAEASKNFEAEGLFSSAEPIFAGGVQLTPSAITKTWSAILDKATREAHVEADDQTVPFDEPFTVMGEKLMYPGDDSLGVSLDNIINCRCNTWRAIQMAELPDYVFHPPNQAPLKHARLYLVRKQLPGFRTKSCGCQKAA